MSIRKTQKREKAGESQEMPDRCEVPPFLDILIGEAENFLSTVSDDMKRLRKMKEARDTIASNKLLTAAEKQHYMKSFSSFRDNMEHSMEMARSWIEDAKEEWSKRQEEMHRLYSDGVVDDYVGSEWEKSQKEYKNKIDKLCMSCGVFFDQ